MEDECCVTESILCNTRSKWSWFEVKALALSQSISLIMSHLIFMLKNFKSYFKTCS